MISKSRRIRRKEISYILSRGKRYNSSYFLVYIVKSDGLEENPSRFSFSVSKKVCKGAVGRNKLRRRGYSIISQNIEKIKPNHLFLFSFKKEAVAKSFSALEKDVLELLSLTLMLE